MYMNYLIEYNNKIIGVFNSFSDAELFILGNLQNNLFNHNVKILTFNSNSCYCSEVKNYYDFDKKSEDNDNDNADSESDTILENKNEMKSKLQYELKLLNIEKKRLDEKKEIYENDLKLFKVFQNKKLDEIPVLFKNSYYVINLLTNIDNLNIDSYFNELDKIKLNKDVYESFEIQIDT